MALQTAADSDSQLASQSTLCRFEQQANREQAVAMHGILIDQFIASFKRPPKRIKLDFDATDDPVHGNQIGRHFSGYYDHYCFLPLYVFCGQKLLVSYLRPASVDAAKHAWAILALLVKRLRAEWPEVKILFRGDSGFCRPKLMSWCERKGVDYIIGIGTNSRLENLPLDVRHRAAIQYVQTGGQKQRCFGAFQYAAKSWKKRERRVIVKAEFTDKKDNNRYKYSAIRNHIFWLIGQVLCKAQRREHSKLCDQSCNAVRAPEQ